MSVDKKELASFRAALDRASTNVIIKRLNDNVIARLWKRDMAEAELERRKSMGDARDAAEAVRAKQHHHSAILKGWILSLILLGVVVFGAFVFLFK